MACHSDVQCLQQWGLSTTTSWRVNSNNGCVLGESVRSWWSTEVKHLHLKTHIWVHMLNPHMHIDDWGNLKIRLINKQLNETNASILVVCYHRYSVFYRVMTGGVRPATQVSSALFPTIIASEYTIVSLQFQWEEKSNYNAGYWLKSVSFQCICYELCRV